VTDGAGVIVRVPFWRRVALPSAIATPFWAGSIVFGWGWGGAFLSLGMVSLGFVGLREEWRVDSVGVSRKGVLGRTRKIAWRSIQAIDVWPGGATLKTTEGGSYPIWGILMNGYPDFVLEVIANAPNAIPTAPSPSGSLEAIAALASRARRS
jgi:hypothetical protein